MPAMGCENLRFLSEAGRLQNRLGPLQRGWPLAVTSGWEHLARSDQGSFFITKGRLLKRGGGEERKPLR